VSFRRRVSCHLSEKADRKQRGERGSTAPIPRGSVRGNALFGEKGRGGAEGGVTRAREYKDLLDIVRLDQEVNVYSQALRSSVLEY